MTEGLVFTGPHYYGYGTQCCFAVQTPDGRRHAATVEVDPPGRAPTSDEVAGMKEMLTIWAAHQWGYV